MSDKNNHAETAGKRRADGHTVHAVTYDPGLRPKESEFANLIEDVESAGWRLDTAYQGAGRQFLIFRLS